MKSRLIILVFCILCVNQMRSNAQLRECISLQTGNHCFGEACHYWLKRTLSLGNEPTGMVGYVFLENNNNQPLDLLTGISGIGSVFLSFLNPNLISWDESIFLF